MFPSLSMYATRMARISQEAGSLNDGVRTGLANNNQIAVAVIPLNVARDAFEPIHKKHKRLTFSYVKTTIA